MYKFTVTDKVDPDLAGTPAIVIGISLDDFALILEFEEGSRLFVRPTDTTLIKVE